MLLKSISFFLLHCVDEYIEIPSRLREYVSYEVKMHALELSENISADSRQCQDLENQLILGRATCYFRTALMLATPASFGYIQTVFDRLRRQSSWYFVIKTLFSPLFLTFALVEVTKHLILIKRTL